MVSYRKKFARPRVARAVFAPLSIPAIHAIYVIAAIVAILAIGIASPLSLAAQATAPKADGAQSPAISTDGAPPPEYIPLTFPDVPGSFAIYHDTRSDAYVGLLYAGGNELIVRLYEKKSGNAILLTHTFYYTSTPGALTLESGTIDLLSGSFDSSPYAARFLPEVYAWLGAWLHSRERFGDASNYEYEEGDRYAFDYWIPILQLRVAGAQGGGTSGEAEASVRLVTAGLAESATDPEFFDFKGIEDIAPGPSYAIEAGTPGVVAMEGISFKLDSAWAPGDDGAYHIAGESGDDAVLSVESIDMSQFGGADTFAFIKLYILLSGATLMPDDLRIFVTGEYPALFYRVYDASSREAYAQYRIFMPRDPTHLSVISLSVFDSLYEKNQAYFDGILF